MSAISGTTSTVSSLLSANRLSINGLASGLDTTKIIDGLLAVQRQRIEQLQAKQTRFTQRQTAYKGIEARLLALQGNLTALARTQNGAFDGRTVASSNKDLVTAAASSSAAPGVYQVQVNSLARAQQIISQGFDSLSSTITQGVLQIRVGGGAAKSITIDGGNNSLQGLANAINAAGAGVTATIINDGSPAGTQPFRLLLTSGSTGASNSISITNSLGDDASGAFKPVFDSSYVGAANVKPGYSGTSTPTSNRGAGAFTGGASNTYTFTALTSGTVGTDNGLQISYTDSTGANTGTLTINAADADVLKNVAQGVQVKLSAGTLVAGESFTIDGFVPLVQAGADASVTVGSGSGGLTVTSATNQIDTLFTGLTLDLHGASAGTPVILTVANDTETIKQAITDFVNSYNDVIKYVDEQTQFDAASNRAGVLLGDSRASTVAEALRNVMTRPVEGLTPLANRLSAIGITTTDQGRLTINATKLDDALAGRLSGVSLNDVRRLFTLSGTSSRPGIEFVTASTKTKSSTVPFTANVTQAAERAAISASNSLASATVLTSANNSLTISVDGNVANITLATGTYTRLALAQELQGQINASSALPGRRVTVALAGDKLTITSDAFGAGSQLATSGGTALTPLGFTGTESDVGSDVAGFFQADGQVETATGFGQFLAGTSTNAHTADLQIRVSLTPAQVGAGVSADVTVTRGVASAVDAALNGLLDPVNGRLKTIDSGLQSTVDDIQKQITRQNQIMESQRNSLVRRFVALERTISQLQGLSNYLGTQFSQISALNSSGR